jgi:high-affinity nickel-transport protein
MLREIAASFRNTGDSSMRRRLVGVYGCVLALHAAGWAAALFVFAGDPAALGVCLLAYGLGLRHAVDADHIAAIDNVTRKLMQDGHQPVGVGFFFSLGHSTIVIGLCLLVALGTGFVQTHYPELQEVGSVIGTSVSAAFLLLIAAINFVIFLRVWRALRAARAGREPHGDLLGEPGPGRGVLARLWGPLFRAVGRSWHMYPVGFLFGLGFDTASEVALLGLAATQASREVPPGAVMVFPLLFTAGMCLIDTTDGVLMLGAYGWAMVKPQRKLAYNLAITLVSFVTALVIGGLEALHVVGTKRGASGGVWSVADALGENSDVLGYAIIGLLAAGWLTSVFIYRFAAPKRPEEAPAPQSTPG